MTKCGTPSCELVRPAPHTTIAVLTGEHDVSTLSRLRQVLDPLNRDSGLLVVIDLSRTSRPAVLSTAITADRARQ